MSTAFTVDQQIDKCTVVKNIGADRGDAVYELRCVCNRLFTRRGETIVGVLSREGTLSCDRCWGKRNARR